MIKFANNSKTTSIDEILSVSNLTDKKRKQAKEDDLKDGTVVVAYLNNGLITPSGYPEHGTKGTIYAVETMAGKKTAMDGSAFVKWEGSNKITLAPLTHIKVASKKVANLDDFSFLSNNSLSQFIVAKASMEDVLVHKATKDLWSLKVSEDGNYDIERLFDDAGDPLKI
jgi:hypothetical protein